jgi:hypothetical protein
MAQEKESPIFEPGAADKPSDDLAQQEALKLGAGENIETDGKRQEHRRHQTFRNQVNIATIGLFWIFVVCIAAGVLVFTWHLIAPICWHFLNDEALGKIQTLLGSALLSSALTGYVSRRMSD